LIGYQANEINDLSLCNWFNYIHPDDRAHMVADMKNYMSNYFVTPETEIFRREYRLIHKKGHFIWVLGMVKIINHDSFGPIMTGFNIDITSIKEAENDLKNALEKNKQLYVLQSRFVTMELHEFRTPLSTIRLVIDSKKNIR
jgi:PAS domain S-box-containing protein